MRWYDWELHIECQDSVFWEEIQAVVYHLHPSFPITNLRKENKENKFRLRSRGWGEFTIGLEVILRDERKARVNYELRLGYEIKHEERITLKEEEFVKPTV